LLPVIPASRQHPRAGLPGGLKGSSPPTRSMREHRIRRDAARFASSEIVGIVGILAACVMALALLGAL